MSYPYPQDRHIDRKEKGEQPYKDAKEAMAQEKADLQTQAEAYGEARAASPEERQQEAEERLAEINRELQDEQAAQ